MTINDAVYGQHEVTELVLVELLASAPLQRLKGIAQFGMPDELNNLDGFSRYDHCVGVMLLLRTHGASVEEQVAGLLHDVSHTAFSHVADFVVGTTQDEGFQDSNHERFIAATEIPAILERHGIPLEHVIDYERYSLLEQPSPRLCADRLDYTLRELPHDVAARCLEGLTTFDGQFVFGDRETALLFAREYLRLQMTRWGGMESSSRYEIFGAVIRRAIELGVMSFDDLWQDDAFVLRKLYASTDDFIVRAIAFLRQRSFEGLPMQNEPRPKKFRFIDPPVIVDGHLVPLTEIAPEYVLELEDARHENASGMRVVTFA